MKNNTINLTAELINQDTSLKDKTCEDIFDNRPRKHQLLLIKCKQIRVQKKRNTIRS